ncbi:MAG TPA: hypothetical protein VHK91_04405 [Flavisolibacter sp.]|nr:hypothetical protein [Flavisolibacter sp.]
MRLSFYSLSLLLSCLCNTAFSQTQRINFEAPYQYPEGVAYAPSQKTFFVSSVRTGTIGKVTQQGHYEPFYQDSSLKSSYGMKVDEKRNRLWVCTGDANYSTYADSATYKKMIRVIGLDLSTGRKTDDINLSNLAEGKHFANDLVLDEAGNLYITDSYAPVVYKIDPQMKPSVLTKSDWFRSNDIGLNGIVYSSKGFLIVANNSDGNLLKIDLKDPQRITKIQLEGFYPGADGLLWNAAGHLVLVQNKGTHKIYELQSDDNWQSARQVAATATTDRFHQPTTATLQGQTVYVLNSKMNELTDPTAPPSKEFSLQVVRFLPSK